MYHANVNLTVENVIQVKSGITKNVNKDAEICHKNLCSKEIIF